MINKESRFFMVPFQLFNKMEAFIALDHERVIFVDCVKHKEAVLGGKV